MMHRVFRKIEQWPAFGTYLLLAYMPFHILLSQSLSLITGGFVSWRIGKDVITFILAALTVILVFYKRKQNKAFTTLVGLAALYSSIYALVWLINSDIYVRTALLGTAYNLRIVAYAVFGFGAVLLAPKNITNQKIVKLLLIVASIVAFLGVLQYFLPKDTLTHIGYTTARGVKPNFFIDDKPDLPRIMSTLRDPNSLAAYLIVPLTISVGLFFSHKNRRMLFGGIATLLGLAVFLTFSRGGLLGALISIFCLVILNLRDWLKKNLKIITVVSILGISIFGSLGYIFRDQYFVQNVILHSDESTKATEDSNELHARLARDGAEAITKEPFGYGPGTAGIVSIQNPKGVVLTENYYVQIGYEVGVVGLIAFLFIWGYVLYLLYIDKSPLASYLIASAIAYAALCLIMHLWTNEAIAATWWITAGMVIGQKPRLNHKS